MIANPSVPAFRFDPYAKKFTRETYEHAEMRQVRGDAVRAARRNLVERGTDTWAVLLGTLGRQGSLAVLKTIAGGLDPTPENMPFLVLLSELSPQKLALFSNEEISTFVQTSCPRLSIDWGYAFSRPLLSPYEASVASGRVQGWQGMDVGESKGKGDYPMDFYAVSNAPETQLTAGRVPWSMDTAAPAAQAAPRAPGAARAASEAAQGGGGGVSVCMGLWWRSAIRCQLCMYISGPHHMRSHPWVSGSTLSTSSMCSVPCT